MKGGYLEHTGTRAADLDRAHRFFTMSLGLREGRRGRMDHGGVGVLLREPRPKQHLELNW